MSQVVQYTIKLRRDTEANWLASTSIPAEGEPCLVLDGEHAGQIKIGDGKHIWSDLSYVYLTPTQVKDLIEDTDVGELAAKVSANTSAIQSNTAAILSNTSAIESNISAIQSNAEAIQSVESSVEAKMSEIEAIESRIDSKASQVESVTSDVSDLKNSVSSINSSVEALDTKLESTQTTVSALETSFSELDAKVSTYDNKISSVESAVSSVQFAVDAQQSVVEALETDVSALSSTVSTYSSSISSLQSSVSSMQSTVDNLNTKLASVYRYKGTYSNLQTLLNAIDAGTVKVENGDVYNITTASDITDFYGNKIKAGDNVAFLLKADGGYKMDCLSGTMDLSGYATTSRVDALESEISTLESESARVSALEVKVSAIESSSSSTESKADAAVAAVSAMQSTVDALDSAVSEVSSKVSEHTSLIEALDSSVDALETKVTSSESSIISIQSSVGVNTFNISAIESQLSNIYTKSEVDSKLGRVYRYSGSFDSIAAINSAIAAGEIEVVDGDVFNIKNGGEYDSNGTLIKAGDNVAALVDDKDIFWDVLAGTVDLSAYATTSSVNAVKSALESSITAVSSKVEAVDSKVEAVDSKVESNVSSINAIQSVVEAQKSSIESLESKVSTDEASISALNSSVEAINSSVSALESSIDALESSVSSLASDVSAVKETVGTIDIATENNAGLVLSSENTNSVSVDSFDGEMSVNNLDFNKVVFDETEDLIIYGGNADLGYTPISAISAEESTGIMTISESGTYRLTNDLTNNLVIEDGAEVVLQLNNCDIGNSTAAGTIVNNGDLTITGNGTVDNVTHAQAAIVNNGTVTIAGGTFTRSQENGSSKTESGGNSYYNIVNHGIMTIKEGTTILQNGAFSSMVENGYYDYNSGNSTTGYVAGVNNANPTLTIDGGVFSGGLNTIKNDDGGIVYINGGTIANVKQAAVLNWNEMYITNGKFSASDDATAIIRNGKINDSTDKGILTISGGKFNANDTIPTVLMMSGASSIGSVSISGGTYSNNDISTYLAEGASITKNSNGKYIVS